MKKELQEKLYKKYPALFLTAPEIPTKPIHSWGIECKDGWYELIDLACIILNVSEMSSFIPTQIKQKFGGLRIYYTIPKEMSEATVNNVSGAIHAIEAMSYKICETCGTNHNVIQTKGYIHTICRPCLHKEQVEYYIKDNQYEFKF